MTVAMLKEKKTHITEKKRDVAVGNFVVTEIKAIRKLQLKQVERMKQWWHGWS